MYVRRTGNYMLALHANHPDYGLPYGTYPRLIFAWMCTEAVRTRTPKLVLGHSLSQFLKVLGIRSSNSGGRWGIRSRVVQQMHRLFCCAITLELQRSRPDADGALRFMGGIAELQDLWWPPRNPDQPMLWTSTIELNHRLFRELIEHAVPINLRVLRAMRRSTLGLDLYLWLTYRTFGLKSWLRLSWRQVYEQLGAEGGRPTRYQINAFRTDVLRELIKLRVAWPDLAYRVQSGGSRDGQIHDGFFVICPTPPQVPPLQVAGRQGRLLPD